MFIYSCKKDMIISQGSSQKSYRETQFLPEPKGAVG